jgi:hypothetical protein
VRSGDENKEISSSWGSHAGIPNVVKEKKMKTCQKIIF